MKLLINILIMILLLMLILQFSNVVNLFTEHENTHSYSITDEYYSSSGSNNMVTAIYLDFRMYDTFFESAILLITVAGIIFMSKKDEDVT